MPTNAENPQEVPTSQQNMIGERVQLVLQIAGGIAGLVAFVYLVGGVVMWFRFRKVGVPADQAVAVMSPEQLFVVGFRLMILPALVAGVLAFLVTWALDHRRTREAPGDQPNPRVARTDRWVARGGTAIMVLAFLALLANATRTGEWLVVGLGTIFVVAAVALLGRISREGHWLWYVGLAVLAAWLILLPFSLGSGVWVAAAVLGIWHVRRELQESNTEDGSKELANSSSPSETAAAEANPANGPPHDTASLSKSRRWIVSVTAAAAFAALVSLAQQADQPVQLLHVDATVARGDSTEVVRGIFVAADAGSVFLGRKGDRQIVALKRDEIQHLALGPPEERAPHRSVLSWLTGLFFEDAHRFSTKGYTWWCDGIQYSWGDILEQRLCRTQPQVLQEQYLATNGRIRREKAARDRPATRELNGRFAPVRVGCPTLSTRPCRGFVRLMSQRTFPITRWTPNTAIVLGPTGISEPHREPAEIRPSRAAEMCLEISTADLGRIRANTTGDANTGVVKAHFRAVISSDEDGDNVLDESNYILRVPKNATQERDASDCPPGLRVSGIVVKPRYAPRAVGEYQVNYHVNRTAQVSIILRNQAGRVVRQLVLNQRVSPKGEPVSAATLRGERIAPARITGDHRVWESKQTVRWRAADRNGRALPQGKYTVTIIAVAKGQTISKQRSIAIDAMPPRVRRINGSLIGPGDALAIKVTDAVSGVSETPAGGQCRDTTLTIAGDKQVGSPDCAWERPGHLLLVYRPSNPWRPGKTYRWRVSARDRAGNRVTATGRVAIRAPGHRRRADRDPARPRET